MVVIYEEFVEYYKKKFEGCLVEVIWREDEGGVIVGVVGFFFGMGKFCLMYGVSFFGESFGYIVDFKVVKVVLSVVIKIFGIEVDMIVFEECVKEMEEIF